MSSPVEAASGGDVRLMTEESQEDDLETSKAVSSLKKPVKVASTTSSGPATAETRKALEQSSQGTRKDDEDTSAGATASAIKDWDTEEDHITSKLVNARITMPIVNLPVCEPQLVTELTHVIQVGEPVEKLGISYALQFDFDFWKRNNVVLAHYLLGRACRSYYHVQFGSFSVSHSRYRKIMIDVVRSQEQKGDLNSGIYHASIGNFISAIHFLKRYLRSKEISSDRSQEGHTYRILGICYAGVGEFNKAIGYLEGHLQKAKDLKDSSQEGNAYLNLGICYVIFGELKKAIDYLKRLLLIAKTLEDRSQEEDAHEVLGICYASVGDYKKAIDHFESHLQIVEKSLTPVEKLEKAYKNLGLCCASVGDYEKAMQYFDRHLQTAKGSSHKSEETIAYKYLSICCTGVGNSKEAIDHLARRLEIAKLLPDKSKEGNAYGHLGIHYASVGDFKKAIQHLERHLQVTKELSYRSQEGIVYGNLGVSYTSLGNFIKAADCLERQLEIAKTVGNRSQEGIAYGNLGISYASRGDFKMAIDFFESQLEIARELEDRSQEGCAYRNLGISYAHLGNFKMATDCHERLLGIAKKLSKRSHILRSLRNLGPSYVNKKAVDLLERELETALNLRDMVQEGSVYRSLGNVYHSHGFFEKSIDYHERSKQVAKKLGNRLEESSSYESLGNAYLSLGGFEKAILYFNLQLLIAKELGDRLQEGGANGNLGKAFYGVGDFSEGLSHFDQQLTIAKGVGHKWQEGSANENLGNVNFCVGEFRKAIYHFECQQKVASVVGNKSQEESSYENLTDTHRSLGDFETAMDYCERYLKATTELKGDLKAANIEDIITSEGGIVAGKNVRLVCPTGAVDDSLSVKITLEDPSNYYCMIASKDLENDVMIAAPIVNLQPNGHFFKKPLTLTTALKIKRFKRDDVFILHGAEARDGKITWQDVTRNSKINQATAEVVIELEHFSLILVLLRWTLICAKDILSRFDLLSFKYTLVVLLNKNIPSSVHDVLALLFVSQDLCHEQFYRENETSALVQLKKEGFVEVHLRSADGFDEKRIYNHENLQVSIQLGEDYKLADCQDRIISFSVDSSVWWSGGKVIKLPLEWKSEVRCLCGTISVQGENGHESKRHFSEGDPCNYLRRLLGLEQDTAFNVVTIAETLKVPKESINEMMKRWKDDDEQLELILQPWSEESADAENLSSYRSLLEGLTREEYRVTPRGQMHISHLRQLALKITGLQGINTDIVKNFSCKATTLCKSVLRDCCIELGISPEDVERTASSSNQADYLIEHFIKRQQLSDEIAKNYKRVCSFSKESNTRIFLAIVPHLIQDIKEIFVDRDRLVPQNGLKGLPEKDINQFLSSVSNAQQYSRFKELVYVECQILEMLCLENHNQTSAAEITKWSERLAIDQMLNFLARFFQDCEADIKLCKRLDLFCCRLRDTLLTDDKGVDEDFMQDFSNVIRELLDFAKFDPSKLVRFELVDSKNSPLSCNSSDVDNVEHDEYDGTYSQRFIIKKESEDELQLGAAACVHIDGSICKKGAFQSVIMLNQSGMDAFNRCMSRFATADIAVMKMEAKNTHSGNLQIVLYASQKEKLSELIQIFKRELSEDKVDLSHSEVSQCYLSMRCIDFTKEKVLRLRLVYKWGSEAVALDSNDFATFSDYSAGGACLPVVKSFGGLDNSLMSEDLEALSLTSVGGKFPSTSFDQLQKHGSAQCGKIEYHLHQTFNQVTRPNTCVIGNQATVNDQTPSQRALPEGLNCSPKRSITEGRRSLPEVEDSKDRS